MEKIRHDTWTQSEIDQLRTLRNQGLSWNIIGAKIGRSYEGCRVKAAGLGIYSPQWLEKLWSQERDDRLRYLNEQGLTSAEIGEQLGVSRNSVIGRRNRLGLAAPRGVYVPRARKINQPRRVWTDEKRMRFAELYATVPAKDIAEEFGISVKTVHNLAGTFRLPYRKRIYPADWKPRISNSSLIKQLRESEVDPPEHECAHTIIEVPAGRCKWPVGSKWCAREAIKIGHGSYCSGHYARSIA